MEDYKLEELVKFRDELNKTGAILKPIPDLAPGYHWTIIGIGAGVAVDFTTCYNCCDVAAKDDEW
nr:ORF65-1 [Ostreid herpesvirus 1]